MKIFFISLTLLKKGEVENDHKKDERYFNFEETLKQKLDYARDMVASKLTEKEAVKILDSVSPDSVKRRFENKTLQKLYKRRINSWKN